ncbi:uncharacterized protein ACO6RY_00418 [Pungitius sinensis]
MLAARTLTSASHSPGFPESEPFICAFVLIQPTGSSGGGSSAIKETRLEKTNPDAARRKRGNHMSDDDECILREKSERRKSDVLTACRN